MERTFRGVISAVDNRNKNNLTLAQRRQAVYRRRKKGSPRRKADILAKAKQVLRRTGKHVYDGKIDAPKFKGLVIVDGRSYKPEEIVAMARKVLAAEAERNNELRAQHGLPPAEAKKLEEL